MSWLILKRNRSGLLHAATRLGSGNFLGLVRFSVYGPPGISNLFSQYGKAASAQSDRRRSTS